LDVKNDVSGALTYAIGRGYQIHPDAFALLKSLNFNAYDIIKKIIDNKAKAKLSGVHCIFIADIKVAISQTDQKSHTTELVYDFEYHRANDANDDVNETVGSYEILFDPSSQLNSAVDEHDYIKLFQSRYNKLLRILGMRPDGNRIRKIGNVKHEYNKKGTSIQENDIVRSREMQNVFVAGLLMSRKQTKKIMEIVIDDMSGALSITTTSDDLRKQISKLVLDQMVMVEINTRRKTNRNFMIKSITSPDIPDRVPNKSQSHSYLVLISDLHVGSKYFMEREFMRFVSWLSSEDEVAKKVKFLCIAGDIIDGIGIFPNQDKEVNEFDSKKQFLYALSLLSQIPRTIQVFIIPGNHDMGRRALPQGALSAFVDINPDNFHMLGNPSLIQLNGVKLLMFHGQSLDDIIATIPGLSYSNPIDAMKILLKARHLSPLYGYRTPIAPEKEDMLVISDVPDIFHVGHVHVMGVERYRNTLLVNSGAWQSQTKYQQTMGIIPTPGIAVFVDLLTLRPFQKDFTTQVLE
jgi:DNA polymerase II small subunit